MNAGHLGLDGQSAIITGAARGLGLAAAARLAAEGVSICAFDLPGSDFSDVVKLGETTGQKIVPFEGDVTSEADWDRAIETCDKEFGGLSILFNNAGISGPVKTVIGYDADDFDKVIAINIRGVFLGIRAAARYMKDAGGGVIVNTSSISGFGGGAGNIFAYTASKHAVNGMTKAAATSLAHHNIRVLGIAPSPAATEMMFQLERRNSPDNPEAARPGLTQGIPMKRYGEPEEIAAVLAFLVSDQASFLTGSTVPVDGGCLAK